MDAISETQYPLKCGHLTIRLATSSDRNRLLAWRNDPDTQKASRNQEPVSKETHERWLKAKLSNHSCQLMIAEVNGEAVGMLRLDSSDTTSIHAQMRQVSPPFYKRELGRFSSNRPSELSWTVAPHARGQGIGSAMLTLFAKSMKEPFIAQVREENASSIRMALRAGMVETARREGLVIFYKEPT